MTAAIIFLGIYLKRADADLYMYMNMSFSTIFLFFIWLMEIFQHCLICNLPGYPMIWVSVIKKKLSLYLIIGECHFLSVNIVFFLKLIFIFWQKKIINWKIPSKLYKFKVWIDQIISLTVFTRKHRLLNCWLQWKWRHIHSNYFLSSFSFIT